MTSKEPSTPSKAVKSPRHPSSTTRVYDPSASGVTACALITLSLKHRGMDGRPQPVKPRAGDLAN